MLLLQIFTCVCLLSGVSAVTTETVVGVVGGKVNLPCRLAAAKQGGVEVCWGRGEPSLFTCHNTVINRSAERTTYRRSNRYSVSFSSSSLSIFHLEPSDSGFYHCRLQLPGLFNDQTSTVHLIIIDPAPKSVKISQLKDTRKLKKPQTTTSYVTENTGSDVTEPMVALVQSRVHRQQVGSLQMFIGSTVKVSFIVFVPVLLLTAANRVWRAKQRPEEPSVEPQEEEEEEGSSV
ncbi:hepatitis A virus cellular receptor 2 homolog [Pholidichthys leucotaenia]